MAVDVVQSSGYLLDYVSDFLMTEWVVIEFAHLHQMQSSWFTDSSKSSKGLTPITILIPSAISLRR